MSVKQAVIWAAVILGILLIAVPVVYTWRQMLWGPVPVAAAPVPSEFPKLPSEQAKRVKERVEQRFQERLAEEKKKWEASAAPKVTEDEFLAAILP